MRRTKLLLMALVGFAMSMTAQEKITIKGHVKFIEEGFKVSVFQGRGSSRKVLAETVVNPDHTYSLEVPVSFPGEAVVDCGHWQSVNVWLENENLDIDFRGLDTAKIKIKNPPFVYIKGGKNNDVMNLINFEGYRSYQRMIAISQAVYRTKFQDEANSKSLSSKLYGMSGDNMTAYMRYVVEHHADCNSVLVALASLDAEEDKALIDVALSQLEKQSEVKFL